MRHQIFFQAGAVWWVIICLFDFRSARKNKACTVGAVVMFNSMLWWGNVAQAARKDPSDLWLKQRLFSPLDCSMRQSRSSRFSQSVNSVNELKTLPQSTGSPQRGCGCELLKLRNQLICVLFASEPHGFFGVSNVFFCQSASVCNQVGCNAFSEVCIHWWCDDSQFVVNKIKPLNLSAKLIHMSSSS